jgi:L-ribulose-5-phosphate 4-epimerase
MLHSLRQEIYRLHLELPRNQLVTWTSGNLSGRDTETGLVVIKPSGVLYPDLTPEMMVIVDAEGSVVEGKMKPSSDTFAHLYIYKHMPEVHGVVHTHSPYATAFAAVGKPIPAVLTAICDEFGGPIPCGGYAKVGGDEIGREIIQTAHENGPATRAVLMKNHGVFTFARTPEEALKAAIMVEDAARTVYFAMQIGVPDEIPPEEVARAHRRYVEEYGQS